RDALTNIGVLSAGEINKLPAIQDAAKGMLVRSVKYHNTISPEQFGKERDAFVNLGLFDAAEVISFLRCNQRSRTC
ncbi:hypothetical protein COY91_02515, partial [Candidatus Shapirobacteria bacterium CG_4_10_14_0_8_um_filter_39_15]